MFPSELIGIEVAIKVYPPSFHMPCPRCGKHIIDQLSLYGLLIKFEIYPKLLLFLAGSDPDHLKIPIFEFLICQKAGIGEMSVESTLLVPLAISIFHNVRFSSFFVPV